jgi:DNA primase
MCLPSIIEIADRAGLECDPRSRNKKEVLYKCPFCLGDANRRKYKLSLNPVYNVYKCWLCGESGGVLQFEAKLFNLPYDEVKRKYSKNRNYHPAEMLSPKQLKLISWDEAKRRNHEHYKRSLDEVLRDWKEYEREQKILHFAKLIVIAHI